MEWQKRMAAGRKEKGGRELVVEGTHQKRKRASVHGYTEKDRECEGLLVSKDTKDLGRRSPGRRRRQSPAVRAWDPGKTPQQVTSPITGPWESV